MSIFDLTGISIKTTENGFVIQLTGDMYKKLGEEINSGKITKPFYHELKKFIREISDLTK
ncbi:MAG: hypothetical protein ACW967_07935 [Candidatus Hodarchaeales archaeon]|jgi:hypothetical protein